MGRDILNLALHLKFINVRDEEYKMSRNINSIDPFAKEADLFEFADAIASFHSGDRATVQLVETFELFRGSDTVPQT